MILWALKNIYQLLTTISYNCGKRCATQTKEPFDFSGVIIKLKRALEKMRTDLVPALIIWSLNLKTISALKDLGIKLQGDAEIDLVLAFVSGEYLHVDVCEFKRADAHPWQAESQLPNKHAVNKAENQLTKDMDVLMAILVGPPLSSLSSSSSLSLL